MMTGLMLYAYSVGIFSSRRIERATFDDEQFGKDQAALDIPEELHRREARLEKIRWAKAARAPQLLDNAAGQRVVSRDESVDVDERRRAGARADRSERAAKELFSKDDDEPPAGGGTAPATELPKHRVPANA
jgi:hypothetical protein